MSDAELQQAGFILPPFHFHCRTTTVAVGVTATQEQYVFSDGTGASRRTAESATVYTTWDGTRFIFRKNYDHANQTMTPDLAISCWNRVPVQIRNLAQKEIEFVEYFNPQDSYWRKIYKNFPNSYATGGNKITFYRYTVPHNSDYVTRTYCHEAAHYIDTQKGKNGVRISLDTDWTKAMQDDKLTSNKSSITDYGENNPKEDFAESVAEYAANKAAFTKMMPHRAAFLKKLLGF